MEIETNPKEMSPRKTARRAIQRSPGLIEVSLSRWPRQIFAIDRRRVRPFWSAWILDTYEPGSTMTVETLGPVRRCPVFARIPARPRQQLLQLKPVGRKQHGRAVRRICQNRHR